LSRPKKEKQNLMTVQQTELGGEEVRALMPGKVCHLCLREFPIFFHGNDEQITRLPDRGLTQLLRDMKQDLSKKAGYLKTLKVSTKFIKPCSCTESVHAYCMTAKVINCGRIQCDKCNGFYKLLAS
jgi:hypothetical protein